MAAFLSLWLGQTPVSEEVKETLLQGISAPARGGVLPAA
jgi:hypothetical protein